MVASADGDVLILDNQKVDKPLQVYNFSVENTPSYFAGVGKLWVHNAKCVLTITGKDAIPSSAIKWKGFSKGQLKTHYEKHGSEFGNITQAEYLKKAKEFSKKTEGDIQEANVGNFSIKYDKDTGMILIGHIKKKEIRTFYIDDGRDVDAFQAAIKLAQELSQ